MECICGCGRKIRGRAVEANLLASRLALELLVWDRARGEGRLRGEAAELESLIERGGGAYRRLLLVNHGEGRPEYVAQAERWLDESFEARLHREDMTDPGSLLRRPQLRFTKADQERLDRLHPERSFTGEPGPQSAGPPPGDQAQRLTQLHAEGVLTDEELAAAMARLGGA